MTPDHEFFCAHPNHADNSAYEGWDGEALGVHHVCPSQCTQCNAYWCPGCAVYERETNPPPPPEPEPEPEPEP